MLVMLITEVEVGFRVVKKGGLRVGDGWVHVGIGGVNESGESRFQWLMDIGLRRSTVAS